MQKTIHVNAYKKRDGTQVKEHDRIIDVVLNPKGCYPQEPELPRVDVPDVIMNMAPVLEGGVSVDVYPTGAGGSEGGGLGDILSGAGGVVSSVISLLPTAFPQCRKMSCKRKDSERVH